MVKRFAFQWFRCTGSKPSARAWAKWLGIDHAWLLRLCRQFRDDPREMLEMLEAQAIEGDPNQRDLVYARERSRQMRQEGKLRPLTFHPWKRYRRAERLRARERRDEVLASNRKLKDWWFDQKRRNP